jgi:hypothetical protein
MYSADKSLARPWRKQTTATEDVMFIYPIYYHNWRNVSTIYVYNKSSIKKSILTIKKIHGEVGRAKDLSAPRYNSYIQHRNDRVFNFLTYWT